MTPKVSIVIEWDNARLSAGDRSVRMLQALRAQALALAFPVEVLVLFDSDQIDGRRLADVIHEHLLPADGNGLSLACRLVPTHGLTYYPLKNKGVELAQGGIVVFVDSDVTLEPGWLQCLLAPFDQQPDIQVVGGHTYIEAENWFSRAFALHWFFPLRSASRELKSVGRHFFANNVAFRKEVLLRYPFPAMPDGMTRGACTMLARRLQQDRIAVWTHLGAKTRHPAPNGGLHFVIRGLAQGRDWAMAEQLDGVARWAIPGKAVLKQLVAPFFRVFKNTIRRGHLVGLPVWQYPAVIAVMWLFYLEVCAGAIFCALAPATARRVWQL